MSENINTARENLATALDEFEAAVTAVANFDGEDVSEVSERAAKAEAEVERRQKIVDQVEKIDAARRAAPVLATDDDDDDEAATAETRGGIKVTREEATYRPDGSHSFFRDLVYARNDRNAMDRLERHRAETEKRDMTAASGGAGYIPPVYLSALAAPLARAGGPLLNALPKAPLPASGTSFTVPRVTTGAAVGVQTEGNTVTEQDMVTSQLTTNVRTIAGQVDISQQLLDRSDPAFDSVVASDLASAYVTEFDRQLINGSSSSSEHTGLLNVGSINSVTFTSSTPTAADFLPKIYKAIEEVASGRYQFPTHIVMHPRRAAFLAAGLSSTFPLFQQGGLNQAVGTQDTGVVGSIAGLPVVVDANMPTTLGSGTDEDAILVIHAPDLRVMEGETRFRVLDAPLSETLEVRLQLFGYSAFLSGRYPEGICKITGTGLNEVL